MNTIYRTVSLTVDPLDPDAEPETSWSTALDAPPADTTETPWPPATGLWAVEEWNTAEDLSWGRLMRVRYTNNGQTGPWIDIANLVAARILADLAQNAERLEVAA